MTCISVESYDRWYAVEGAGACAVSLQLLLARHVRGYLAPAVLQATDGPLLQENAIKNI
ncbi:MAG: hypothetical protein ACLTDC_05715 [Lachnospiraceae bacterium]